MWTFVGETPIRPAHDRPRGSSQHAAVRVYQSTIAFPTHRHGLSSHDEQALVAAEVREVLAAYDLLGGVFAELPGALHGPANHPRAFGAQDHDELTEFGTHRRRDGDRGVPLDCHPDRAPPDAGAQPPGKAIEHPAVGKRRCERLGGLTNGSAFHFMGTVARDDRVTGHPDPTPTGRTDERGP
jgi:hypothetical protein